LSAPELAGKVAIVTEGAGQAQILRRGQQFARIAVARDGAPEVEAA
jgi:hypothetical protein